MTNELEVLSAALKRAADIEGLPVSCLTENILREWLAGHGFLDRRCENVAGAAAIIMSDSGPVHRAEERGVRGRDNGNRDRPQP